MFAHYQWVLNIPMPPTSAAKQSMSRYCHAVKRTKSHRQSSSSPPLKAMWSQQRLFYRRCQWSYRTSPWSEGLLFELKRLQFTVNDCLQCLKNSHLVSFGRLLNMKPTQEWDSYPSGLTSKVASQKSLGLLKLIYSLMTHY